MAKTSLFDLTAEMVAADTVPSRSSVAAMERIADRAESLGARVRLQRFDGEAAQANLVAVLGPDTPDGLVLSGHLDVVPFDGQPGWTREALRLAEEDGRLYGRGTSDMKAFLAQCLVALEGVDAERLERPVVLLFTADEEVGCQGSRRMVRALPELLGETPAPRLAWIGEPTSGAVFHAHKGIVAFEVEVAGAGGHSSIPEAGTNAIGVAARCIDAIAEIQQQLREQATGAFADLYPEAPYTTLNFGTIEGGSASNMIAESCRFSVSYRPLPDEPPLGLYERIQERILDPALCDRGSPQRPAQLTIGRPLVAPGMLSPKGTGLEAALREIVGEHGEGGAPFCTDGGHFADAGIDSLVCGPGDLTQAHQPDESIDAAAFHAGPEQIRRVVERLCVGGG